MGFISYLIIVFVVFALILGIRNYQKVSKWMNYVLINIITSAIFIYIINLIVEGDILPMNSVVLITSGLLGVPGLLGVMGIKFLII
ncbi:pro-sigmaK processing inhibitor BofA family protein [Chengkuizengella sp. SCS-71B]|uniref:pro-sigmaK processing inhibitor BofA family protein n=1 Tax=Chengkuizengella sp. SCS-71B TaxID=3115290 RepID=UPI0032C21FFE